MQVLLLGLVSYERSLRCITLLFGELNLNVCLMSALSNFPTLHAILQDVSHPDRLHVKSISLPAPLHDGEDVTKSKSGRTVVRAPVKGGAHGRKSSLLFKSLPTAAKA